jgi:hypothetical protein
MTPEALVVHYADDLDAKLQMMANALAEDSSHGHLTTGRTALGNAVYKGCKAIDPTRSTGAY